MRRLSIAFTTVVMLLLVLVPSALAADEVVRTDDVLVAVNGPIEVAADERLDALVVIDGEARISGYVDTIVVAGGTATLSGATARTLVVLDGTADLGAGTTILGDVHTFDGSVTTQEGAVVEGTVSGLEDEFAALAVLLIPLTILFFLGIGMVAIAAALVVAAFAARQVREVEATITREPGQSLVAGLVGLIGLPLVAVLLIVTVVGAPVGLTLLIIVLPAVALLGWLVAAIWVGDWLVARMRGTRESERPYLAAILGVIVLALAGVLPFVSAIATLFGLGGLLLVAWRTLRREQPPVGGTEPMQPVASAS